MTTKDRGYTLIEMLIIIAVLAIVITLSVKPFRTIISDIPRSSRIFQAWNTTTEVMKQLKADVEQSSRIIDLSDGLLTLEHGDSKIVYTFLDGKISRKASTDNSESLWKIPHVKINTQLWISDNIPYAIEITTWNQQNITGREQKRLRQSFVYYQKESSQVQ